MPMMDYLKKREIQLFMAIGFLVAILVLYQFGALIVYGVPAVTFHTISQTKPISKSVIILNSFGDWVAYEYYGEAYGEWKNLLQQIIYVKVGLAATLKVKVETSDLLISGFLTEISPPPFLIQESETTIYYKNMTIHVYAYGFKVTLAWSGSVQVTILEAHRDMAIIGGPSFEDLTKLCVRDTLIPDFNAKYLVAAKLLLSIDAPTLATEKAYALRPDYLGLCGMWLASYEQIGYTTGTATEALPASSGTAVKFFRDKDLTSPCWAPDYDKPMGKPLLTPDIIFWLDHFSPASAWWEDRIVNLGSQLVYDGSKAHPNYVSWAWEKWGKDAPAIAQWFRVDIAFRVTKDWIVPRIPDYELPQEIKDRMKIIVTVEPENKGVPLNPPSQEAWYSALISKLIPILIIVLIGTIATVIIYYYVKAKWGVKR